MLSITHTSDTTQACVYLPNFYLYFVKLYNEVNPSLLLEFILSDLDAGHHFITLNTAWTDILNLTAPFKHFKEPWVDHNIRSHRQSCREGSGKRTIYKFRMRS